MNKNMVALQRNHEKHMEINIKHYLMYVKLLLPLIQSFNLEEERS